MILLSTSHVNGRAFFVSVLFLGPKTEGTSIPTTLLIYPIINSTILVKDRVSFWSYLQSIIMMKIVVVVIIMSLLKSETGDSGTKDLK